VTRPEMLALLREIRDGKDGQMIPYNIIKHAIEPLAERACLPAAIYLLEQLEDSKEECE
jgi:hypothetical protein